MNWKCFFGLHDREWFDVGTFAGQVQHAAICKACGHRKQRNAGWRCLDERRVKLPDASKPAQILRLIKK